MVLVGSSAMFFSLHPFNLPSSFVSMMDSSPFVRPLRKFDWLNSQSDEIPGLLMLCFLCTICIGSAFACAYGYLRGYVPLIASGICLLMLLHDFVFNREVTYRLPENSFILGVREGSPVTARTQLEIEFGKLRRASRLQVVHMNPYQSRVFRFDLITQRESSTGNVTVCIDLLVQPRDEYQAAAWGECKEREFVSLLAHSIRDALCQHPDYPGEELMHFARQLFQSHPDVQRWGVYLNIRALSFGELAVASSGQ